MFCSEREGEVNMTQQEITDIIYDTLMQNMQYKQLDLNIVDNQEVDSKGGLILFDYDIDTMVKINISILAK
jgi:hypothetical protein